MKPKVIGKYTIEKEEFPDGRIRIKRTTEGITAFELYWHLEQAQEEISKQIKGIIKPDIIKRRIIK